MVHSRVSQHSAVQPSYVVQCRGVPQLRPLGVMPTGRGFVPGQIGLEASLQDPPPRPYLRNGGEVVESSMAIPARVGTKRKKNCQIPEDRDPRAVKAEQVRRREGMKQMQQFVLLRYDWYTGQTGATCTAHQLELERPGAKQAYTSRRFVASQSRFAQARFLVPVTRRDDQPSSNSTPGSACGQYTPIVSPFHDTTLRAALLRCNSGPKQTWQCL